MSRRQKIKVLERRRDHLAERSGDAPDSARHYDRAERAALEWAIPILQAHVEDDEADRVQERLAFGADPAGS